MPPKGKDTKKLIEDKTFGMKNKNKSSKAQKYMQQLESQLKNDQKRKEQKGAAEENKPSKKEIEAQRKAELAELFKPVQTVQKVPFGVDPKTLVCQFFKLGQCTRGNKCKFSHDLNIERKSQKIDLYTDARQEEKEKDTMDTWDQEKLESVVKSKHVSDNLNKPTEIVCKYFLEAIETSKYGWFWVCPNGGNSCKYRHALPPGFVLKKKETEEERRAREEEEKENALTIEDFLETERHNLGSNLTPITYETFEKWKSERKARQQAEAEEAARKKREAYKKEGGRSGMQFSGRELFEFNPQWAGEGDAEEGAVDVYIREESDSEEPAIENLTLDENEQVTVDEALFANEEDLGLDDDDDE